MGRSDRVEEILGELWRARNTKFARYRCPHYDSFSANLVSVFACNSIGLPVASGVARGSRAHRGLEAVGSPKRFRRNSHEREVGDPLR